MSKKNYLVHIDLNKNELQNEVIQNLSTAQAAPKVGQIYYDIEDTTAWMWNGSWVDLAQQSIADGDYGDITVSASGATWSIDADSVTYAKMQNMTTARMLGRVTAATGVVEELTAAQVRTLINVEDGATADQTSIVGITGTKAQFDAAVTDGNFLYVGDVVTFPGFGSVANHTDVVSATNTAGFVLVANGTTGYVGRALLEADISDFGSYLATGITTLAGYGISDTKANFNTALSDGSFLFSGDISQYTDELAQDATGAMIANTATINLTYVDATPALTADVNNNSITYAKMQNAAGANIFLGNIGVAGALEELTGTQATSMLDIFTSALKGLVPASGGGTSNFLRADGTFAAPTGGFINYSVGGDVNANQVINSGNVLDIVGGTGLTTTITKASTTATLSVALDSTTVGAGSYGSASAVATFTVDAQGRLTAAATTAISITASQINDLLDDDTFASASATTVASSESIKAYIASVVSGQMVYSGGYDASVAPPTGAGILKGFTYTVTVAGNGSAFFAETLQIGDMIVAEQNNPTLDAHWTQVNKNIPDIVNASETAKGIVEEATDAEVAAGTATGATGAKLFITPAKLKTHLGETATVSTARVFRLAIGNGALLTIPVTHDLGEQFVKATVVRNSVPYDVIECEVQCTSTTVTTFLFNEAPTASEFMVVITG